MSDSTATAATLGEILRRQRSPPVADRRLCRANLRGAIGSKSQIGTNSKLCWREIVNVAFEIVQAAKRQAIAGQCILDIAQAQNMRRAKIRHGPPRRHAGICRWLAAGRDSATGRQTHRDNEMIKWRGGPDRTAMAF